MGGGGGVVQDLGPKFGYLALSAFSESWCACSQIERDSYNHFSHFPILRTSLEEHVSSFPPSLTSASQLEWGAWFGWTQKRRLSRYRDVGWRRSSRFYPILEPTFSWQETCARLHTPGPQLCQQPTGWHFTRRRLPRWWHLTRGQRLKIGRRPVMWWHKPGCQ